MNADTKDAVLALAPCPFCGAAPEVYPKNPAIEGDGFGQVRCENDNCPAQPCVNSRLEIAAATVEENIAAAIAAWNRRATAPLLDGREEEFGEALADAINRARYGTEHPFGPRPLADEDRTSQEYARRLARACLPLIRARIAQAEQAATEREREACASLADIGLVRSQRLGVSREHERVIAHHIAAAIRARNTEKDRSDD